METNWAAEHLQVIRTLMERSAVYRRALAPVMIITGSIGLAGAVLACFVTIDSNRRFSFLWMGLSFLAVLAAYLFVRRQALKDGEPFWSPPTRRVTQALLPPFVVGLMAGALFLLQGDLMVQTPWLLAIVWLILYGCALHAAGFFMQRGIKLFGWVFVLSGCALFFAPVLWPAMQTAEAANYIMGIFFGVLHLAYGLYLYFTEKRKQAA
jgi:hypothetical protein